MNEYIDPHSGARYTWPDDPAAPGATPLSAEWTELGYTDQDAVATSLARRWVADYDREHPPVDFSPAFASRFMCGVDPATLDEDVTIAWGDVFPIAVETKVRVLEDDMVELFFGGGVIPLCSRRVPCKGQE